MRFHKLLAIILLNLTIIGCGDKIKTKKSPFSIQTVGSVEKFTNGETIEVTITNPTAKTIDSVSYHLNKNVLQQTTGNSAVKLKIETKKLGTHVLTATIYADGNITTTQKKLTVLHTKAPELYAYTIAASYPHDMTAYTQGLEFNGDTLIESTGRYGYSTIRKTNFSTGEIYKKVALDKNYFAEGLTLHNNKIYQLTWQEDTGFIYNSTTLKKTGTFAYNKSKEGWGLCKGAKYIYKSDGTDKIWKLNPTTLEEIDFIQVTTNKGIKTKFNELEWIDGKIYANTYQKDGIAIINPDTGALEGVVNLSGLRDKVTQHGKLDVLNGIAYHTASKKLFVTGKNWDKLFEIQLVLP